MNSPCTKAVILAAGKGTRMRDLTQERPKPMLEVEGKPILQHILEGVRSAGIRQAFIVTGYCAEAIEDYFGSGARLGMEIHYGRQMVQDGTGKAPELARSFVASEPFLLTYGDILVPPDTYAAMQRRFQEGPFSGLVTVTRGEDVSKGAILLFQDKFLLQHLVEKPTPEQLQRLREEGLFREGDPAWYNAGIYLFTPELFRFTEVLEKSPRGEYELTDAVLGMVRAGHAVAGLEIAGRWVDVRDPEVLARLNAG